MYIYSTRQAHKELKRLWAEEESQSIRTLLQTRNAQEEFKQDEYVRR